jgi:hypothetical protein
MTNIFQGLPPLLVDSHVKPTYQRQAPVDSIPVFHTSKRHVHVPSTETESHVEMKWKTNSLIDNFLVEMLSSIMVNLSVIFSWDWSGDNFALQFIPGIALGLIMLCIKDEDYFFPDGSPMVTILIWTMGGYFSWIQSLVRLMAHGVGFAISLWLCTSSPIPLMTYHKKYDPAVYFGMEALTTSIEHIAVVYVVMPLLPPMNKHGSKFLFPKFKPKSHPETEAPSNSTIMHAALVFSTIHWIFWRMLNCEMNPSVLILLSYLRVFQENEGLDIMKSPKLGSYGSSSTASVPVDHWNYCIMGVWGQFIGLAVSLLYALFFIPRSHQFYVHSPYHSQHKKAQSFQ